MNTQLWAALLLLGSCVWSSNASGRGQFPSTPSAPQDRGSPGWDQDRNYSQGLALLNGHIPGLNSNSSSGGERGSGKGTPLCAYRVMESGGRGRFCFRDTQKDFTCHSGECLKVRSPGGLVVANVLANGSVLIQWGVEELEGPVRRGGFGLSCWWNGSYTQFECGAVHLGSSCRDYLLGELHENVPYRVCLRALALGPPCAEDPGECVDFTVLPSGMQDIVVAMTTVGGAICVMLVVICLLVAYITEKIMSPSVRHAHSTQHTHGTHMYDSTRC